jgi:hypothetical protein
VPATDRPDGIQPSVTIAPAEGVRSRVNPAAEGRRRRAQVDPDLGADLQDWYAPGSGRPRIGILGPVEVDAPGQQPPDRLRFYREIVVYLSSRGARGATAAQLDDAIWPERSINASSRRIALSRVRIWLGDTPDGEPWLPPNLGADRVYRIAQGYLLDWHLFRRLRARGEAHGAASVPDLRRALGPVRGVPMDGADQPKVASGQLPWEPQLPACGLDEGGS